VIRRLPQIAFALLALATVGAFFLVQALKTDPPLVWAAPHPQPNVIDPVHGHECTSVAGTRFNYRESAITISVHNSDTVGIYIVSSKDPAGNPKATISSGTPMRGGPQHVYPKTFVWNGRLADGQPAAPGLYYFRIVLEHQGRSVNISEYPVRVITQRPHAKILSVRTLEARSGTATTGTATTMSSTAVTATATTGTQTSDLTPVQGPAVLSPPHGHGVRITYTSGNYSRVWLDIYRTDVAGHPEFVRKIPVDGLKRSRNWTTWDGEIDGEPAPAGTYLIGITARNQACDQATWPATIPPVPGTTGGAGVTIRYLSVTPPLTPTTSGSHATVAVDSPVAGFSWSLHHPGSSKTLVSGIGATGSSEIQVPMPRHHAGVYSLTVSSGTQSQTVPLVASQAGKVAAHARVLVVVPMLTWMGNTPVDDSGDGLPDTLRAGDSVSLARPLVDGPPTGFGADSRLVSYLTAHHLSYQLTTDVALAEDLGPSLADRGGVVLPEGENFLPQALASTLRGFVRGGGRALVLGTGELSGTSRLSGFPTAPRAAAPALTFTDPFGATRGPITPTGGETISEISDPLDLFSDATAFSGFSQYQPIRAPSGAATDSASVAGIGNIAPAIVGFHYGSGTVIEVGLPGFTATLSRSSDSQQLLVNAWQLLSQ
jgi:flagellar hook assembly protein FlgD